ncbi:MAG: transcription termination factor Rho [Caldisericia bacterium]|nr:transcription termination factor Rho [Caldisericia bacterium]
MSDKTYTYEELDVMTARELYDICKDLKIKNYTSFKKNDLINEIIQVAAGEKEIVRKKRGRKSKAELEAMRRAIEEAEKRETEKLYGPIKQEPKPQQQPQQHQQHQQHSEQRQKLDFDQPLVIKHDISHLKDHKETQREQSQDQKNDDDDSQGHAGGVLEIHPDGYGFLRTQYVPSTRDVYLAPSQIRRFGFRNGDFIEGMVRFPTKQGEKYAAMLKIETCNGVDPESLRNRPNFESLVPIFPNEKLKMELPGRNDITLRVVDLVAPIGKGQRGMIVSPPKAGKTTVIKKIAQSISVNHPEVTLMILLVDERPEEVTDMQRSVNAQVISSTFDQLPENHIRVVELAIERAKRLVEMKKDVVILMDGITRLTRAYNLVMTPTGRTLTGGLDTSAIHGPKKILGAARNIDNGGSLTIIATSLIETGSKMDEVIYEEFKGTGNMELVLDRKLAEKGVYPAIDINRSGTRRDELLFDDEMGKKIRQLRRFLTNLDPTDALDKLYKWLQETRDNKTLLQMLVAEKR